MDNRLLLCALWGEWVKLLLSEWRSLSLAKGLNVNVARLETWRARKHLSSPCTALGPKETFIVAAKQHFCLSCKLNHAEKLLL